jgi:glucose-6-phosphate isomerase
MAGLEAGAIANPDEGRMVGHYWLRNPQLAPTPEIRKEIEDTLDQIKAFAADVQTAKVRGSAGAFKNLLVIGIGGSALGPQFVSAALGHPKRDLMHVFFFDNTDPDGMQKVLANLDGQLGKTLCLVISKSGGTKESRNGMLEARHAYEAADLDFAAHAVAITGKGSELDKVATKDGWLARFPMWDWVGGRTSELSAVGLLPAALQGLDIDGLLAGARACDEITRKTKTLQNPAALLALMWYYAGDGKGKRDMVVLPYKDRLELFSRYLQQLIMESLGKEKDLAGNVVNQGLAVYGNKGSTDQHAYIQQLREGLNNFFAVFIEVLKDQEGEPLEVEPNTTSGDYLIGFFLGTRRALYENKRESVTITLTKVNSGAVGTLIALFERAVGLYASMINVNAFHQPGVEAGKKAAAKVLALQEAVLKALRDKKQTFSLTDLSKAAGAESEIETVFKICEHLAVNSRGVKKVPGRTPFESSYQAA